MADEEIKEAIIKALEEKYYMIPQRNWHFFVGGLFSVICFMILAIIGSYQMALKAASNVVSDTGAKATIAAINEHGEEAKKSRDIVDKFAIDIKNGDLKRRIIESLKSDTNFQKVTKGDKGDPGVSIWEDGKYKNSQYIRLKNSSQKDIARIGSSSEYDDGIIELFDSSGSPVVRIDNRGFFIRKGNDWIEPYVREDAGLTILPEPNPIPVVPETDPFDSIPPLPRR